MKLTLTNQKSSCPSQWVGKDGSGEDIYARYRWGYLVVRRSKPGEPGVVLFEGQIGDDYDGDLSNDKLRDTLATAQIKVEFA